MSLPTFLSTMDLAYLDDMAQGREYSFQYSPYSVKQILARLKIAKAVEFYQAEGGRERDMVRISEYGKQIRGMK